jgi:pilus assembly protein CpaC
MFSINRKIITAFTLLLLLPAISAQAANEKIEVTVGQSVTRTLDMRVSTVSVADANLADVIVAGPQQILVNGKDIGLTTLVIWDEDNKSKIYDVIVRGPFSDQKIELRVKLAEVNRTKASELGIDLLYTNNAGDDWTGGTYGGPVSTPSVPLSIFNGIPTEDVTSIFRWASGGQEVTAMVQALEGSGVIRVLAEPNVVAASGEKANFLSGGEIPVPIASSGTTGGSTVTIEWKEFGVKVDFLPTIVDEGVINLNLSTEVSSLDYSNGVEISGFRIPALRSRKGSTTVELMDQETLVIGGLILEEENVIETKIPILGHIPVLGWLFRSKREMTSTTELMLVVSPAITRALPPGVEVELPTIETDEEAAERAAESSAGSAEDESEDDAN